MPTFREMVALVEAAVEESNAVGAAGDVSTGGGGWFVPGDATATGEGLWLLLARGWSNAGCEAVDGDRVFPFAVKCGAEMVGIQGLSLPSGNEVGVPAETWSWMMPKHRGKGHGLRARRAVLAVAFDVCGAAVCVSTHDQGNRASAVVSARAGYRKMGMVWASGGERAVELWRHDTGSWRRHVSELPRSERPVVGSVQGVF